MKCVNGVLFDDLLKAYEKQEENNMVEDVDSTGVESEEVVMESV